MNRKLLKNIEYPVLIAIVLLTILSVVIISSATHATSPEGSFARPVCRLCGFWRDL